MLNLHIIDRYIIRKYLSTFLFTMIFVTVILVVVDLSEKITPFLKEESTLERIFFEYYAGSIPFYIVFSYPLVNFIAVLFMTSRLSERNEIISFYAAGVSYKRLLRPYLLASFLLTLIMLLLTTIILPFTNGLKYKYETEILNPTTQQEQKGVPIKLSENTLMYIGKYAPETKAAFEIKIYQFQGFELIKKEAIASMHWIDTLEKWRLRDVNRHLFFKEKEKKYNIPFIDTILPLKPKNLEGNIYLFSMLNFQELNETLAEEKLRGTGNVTRLILEKYKRIIFPFATLVLSVIGFSIASGKRKAGLGLTLGIGVILSFIFVLLTQFADIFATHGGLNPFITLLFPIFVYSCIMIFTLINTHK